MKSGFITGAAIPRVVLEDFKKIIIRFPTLLVQRKIASVLSAYDDLIENNTHRIRILEQMAHTLYHDWFGKVYAQSLPEGWNVVKMGDVADIQWGDTSVTKLSYVDDGYTAYSASGPDGKLAYYDFNRKGIVLSAIGANCGKIWFAHGKWSCIKNTIRFWATTKKVSTEYLFFVTSDESFWPKRGAAQPFISQGDARAIIIVCPKQDLIDKFTSFTSDALEQIDALERKNVNLRRTRDLLLPRLVSVEVGVDEMELAV